MNTTICSGCMSIPCRCKEQEIARLFAVVESQTGKIRELQMAIRNAECERGKDYVNMVMSPEEFEMLTDDSPTGDGE